LKKLFGEFGVGVVIILCIMAIALSIEGCHYTTRNLGGEMTVELEPGQKLEEITWKEDSLWILSRPMRDDEVPETHTFYEDAEWGVLEGKITVIEKEE
jgi:hypothetical protein